MIDEKDLKPETRALMGARIQEAITKLAGVFAEQNLKLEFVGVKGPRAHVHYLPFGHHSVSIHSFPDGKPCGCGLES